MYRKLQIFYITVINVKYKQEDRFKKITGASDVVNRVIGTNQINRANDDLFKEVEKSFKEPPFQLIFTVFSPTL